MYSQSGESMKILICKQCNEEKVIEDARFCGGPFNDVCAFCLAYAYRQVMGIMRKRVETLERRMSYAKSQKTESHS
jgi:hypothetical protein